MCQTMAHLKIFHKIMTELAIFDLDGTLLNTIEDIGRACNYALKECGYPERDMREYNMMVGRGIMNLFRKALPEEYASEENVARMRDYFVPYYNTHNRDFTVPYPGIETMLAKLSEAGVKLAVASNKYQEGTEMLVKHYFPQFEFVKVLGQRDGMPIKPDAAIVWEAMAAVPGISRENVVYCGDSDVDMMTGKNAGVKTIGVTWGFRTREELLIHSPAMLAEKASDITDEILSRSIPKER